ncbi:MAG: carboxylating nicotinate-nucleotide diphosphorylase [Immundisolibacteraceae bacterium]|nr:carboxylating nicotinate-nucleotide diphosphorylase [Immundisolibacteraceae bacterium]
MKTDSLTAASLFEQVQNALSEDIGASDLTAALIPAEKQMKGRVIAREPGVLAGSEWFNEVFRQVDPTVTITWLASDGDLLTANQPLCTLEGPARALLTGERTALNFIQLLSAVASRTRRYVDAVCASNCKILDTRKTIPGLRLAQKYAVLCGGGKNHRIGLFDAVLIKENHIASAGSIAAAVSQARENASKSNNQVMVEVEVESLEELTLAIAASADRILLDNFSLTDLKTAVKTNSGRSELEASGGITLQTIGPIANTGVDFISVGELTKTIDALDLSMRLK